MESDGRHSGGPRRALYYYNLGCNVPVYLHIDLRKDNRTAGAVVVCLHVPAPGHRRDATGPGSGAAQQEAMRNYRQWEASSNVASSSVSGKRCMHMRCPPKARQ